MSESEGAGGIPCARSFPALNLRLMNPQAKTFPWTTGIGLLLVILTLAMAFLLVHLKSRIAHTRRPAVYGQVHDFTLTNQNGAQVSLADLRGRPWIADIIFTRCAGPCLRMSRQLKELQDALPPGSPARLVSLTTDPDFDTPPVLSRYAKRFGADTNRWMFLTGTKTEIGRLATGDLKLSAVARKPEEQTSPGDLFVHSTIFVVVDRHAQLRGIFETAGDGVDWQGEKKKILATAKQLERER
jgi:cytochrome oxidase Cu insertion factor (SCO1/SenC/PrrC family)